jgi:hypothetical protein
MQVAMSSSCIWLCLKFKPTSIRNIPIIRCLEFLKQVLNSHYLINPPRKFQVNQEAVLPSGLVDGWGTLSWILGADHTSCLFNRAGKGTSSFCPQRLLEGDRREAWNCDSCTGSNFFLPCSVSWYFPFQLVDPPLRSCRWANQWRMWAQDAWSSLWLG